MGTAVPCRTHLLVDAVTGYKMSGRCFFQLRSFFFATLCSIRTARMEAASGRRIDRARKISFQAAFLLCFCQPWIRNGNGRKQSCRIGMQGVGVNLICLAFFHKLTEIHNPDIIRNIPHHRQIMCNEKIRQQFGSSESTHTTIPWKKNQR